MSMQTLERPTLKPLFRRMGPAILCCSALYVLTAGAWAQVPAPKQIDGPDGGHVIYGPVPGASTMAAAMGATLRQVHTQFGDRPQIGRFFQSRNGDSVATFFTVHPKNGNGKTIGGLAIVSLPGGSKPAAAILYDTPDRFAQSEPMLMNKLMAAWQKEGTGAAPANSGPVEQTPAATLHYVALADNSGRIAIPEGWRLTGGGSGQVHVAGPNGEMVNLGVIVQNIYDPQNPRASQMIRYMQMSRKPIIVCPYNVDLVQAYQCVLRQARASQNLPAVNVTVSQQQPLAAGPYLARQVLMTAQMDAHDGKGPLNVRIQVGQMREGPQGGWALTISSELIPQALAEREWPTVRAIAASYRQNGQVLMAQSEAVVNDIHRQAAANQKLIDARTQANDEHNRSVDQYWDDNAKRNKAFENYTLDRAVVSDNEDKWHGTFDYPTADAFVRSNPDRFQYVATQDLLKGIDY